MINNNNVSIDEIIRVVLEKKVSKEIDDLIEMKTQEFHSELLDRKDKYIADVVKSIRITHEQLMGENKVDYIVTFMNIGG